MSVRRVMTLSTKGAAYELLVEGATYGPEGRVLSSGQVVDRNLLVHNPVLNELAHICNVCNDAKVVFDAETDVFSKVGEPTEAALKTLVEKLGTDSAEVNRKIPFIETTAVDSMTRKEKMQRVGLVADYVDSKYRQLQTLEFSRDRKSMSTLVEKLEDAPNFGSGTAGRTTRATASSAAQVLFVKGAPEAMLERCSHARINGQTVELTVAMKETILGKVVEWADAEALRVLAFATVDKPSVPSKVDPTKYASYEVVIRCY
jgi:Ca2+ transporting ATPase